MKALLLVALLLLAAGAPPASHSAHRRAGVCSRQVPHKHLHPLRVLRTPQAPKLVRAVPKTD